MLNRRRKFTLPIGIILLLLLAVPTALAGDPFFGASSVDDGAAINWGAQASHTGYPPDWDPEYGDGEKVYDGPDVVGGWAGFFDEEHNSEKSLALPNLSGPTTNGAFGAPPLNSTQDIVHIMVTAGNTRCGERGDKDVDAKVAPYRVEGACVDEGGYYNKDSWEMGGSYMHMLKDVNRDGKLTCGSSGDDDPYCWLGWYKYPTNDGMYLKDYYAFRDWVRAHPDKIYIIGDEFDWAGKMNVHPRVAAEYFADMHGLIETQYDIAKGTPSNEANAQVYYGDLGNNLRYYHCRDWDNTTRQWMEGDQKDMCNMLVEAVDWLNSTYGTNIDPVIIEPDTYPQGYVGDPNYSNGEHTSLSDARSYWNVDNSDYWYLVGMMYDKQAAASWGSWMRPTGFNTAWGMQNRRWYWCWDLTGPTGFINPDMPNWQGYLCKDVPHAGRSGTPDNNGDGIVDGTNLVAIDFDRDGYVGSDIDGDGYVTAYDHNNGGATDPGDKIRVSDDPSRTDTYLGYSHNVIALDIVGEDVTKWSAYAWNAFVRRQVTAMLFRQDWFGRNASIWRHTATSTNDPWGAGGYVTWWDDGNPDTVNDCYPGDAQQQYIAENPKWPANPFGRYGDSNRGDPNYTRPRGDVTPKGKLSGDWGTAGYNYCDLGLGDSGQGKFWGTASYDVIEWTGTNNLGGFNVHDNNLTADNNYQGNWIRQQSLPDFRRSGHLFTAALLDQIQGHWEHDTAHVGQGKYRVRYYIARGMYQHIGVGEDPHGWAYQCGDLPFMDNKTGGVRTPRALAYNEVLNLNWQWWGTHNDWWNPSGGSCFASIQWPYRYDDKDGVQWGDLPPGW